MGSLTSLSTLNNPFPGHVKTMNYNNTNNNDDNDNDNNNKQFLEAELLWYPE